jgi:hypothetical protein
LYKTIIILREHAIGLLSNDSKLLTIGDFMPTVEELQKQLEDEKKRADALQASKDRIENESKTYKQRAQEAEGKLTDAEKKKLEDEGKLQELLNKEREDNKKLNERLSNTMGTALREKLRTEIAKEAPDAHDIDMVLKVADHKDLLKIDEDALTVEGVKDFVGKCKETHKYLFKSSKLPDTHDTKGKGDVDDKTDDEKYLAELEKAQTREDITKIKKKYGKPVDEYTQW